MEEKILEELETKSQSKLKWFFMVILIPSIFALTVALVVATVAGVNVYERVIDFKESIPFLSSKEKEIKEENIQLESKLITLNEDIKERETEISKLTKEVKSRDEEIKKLQLEKEQLEREISQLAKVQSENKMELNNVVKTYETMAAKKAAPIIIEMNDEEALQILSNLKPDTLASIMEQMKATDAAKYTSLLNNKDPKNES